jgi:hypothetical protein
MAWADGFAGSALQAVVQMQPLIIADHLVFNQNFADGADTAARGFFVNLKQAKGRTTADA